MNGFTGGVGAQRKPKARDRDVKQAVARGCWRNEAELLAACYIRDQGLVRVVARTAPVLEYILVVQSKAGVMSGLLSLLYAAAEIGD